MNKTSLVFLIVVLGVVITAADAQEITFGDNAKQKLVQVTIDMSGNVHVKHVIEASGNPRNIVTIDGEVSELKIQDVDGEYVQYGVVGDNDSLTIFPSNEDVIIEYNLSGELREIDRVWTWNFRYLQNTQFIFPDEIDMIFVNEKPVYLGGKDVMCHGCQMKLEFIPNETKTFKEVKWEDRNFLVEIRTLSEIENFEFVQEEKMIGLDVLNENKFVTTIIPLELLWEPYDVVLEDEMIYHNEYINNGTHVWLSFKPDEAGHISIIGTTVVPEFPLMMPLVFGIVIMLALQMRGKISFH